MFRGSKVFPAFRQFLQCSPEEEPAKRAALLAELEAMNELLSRSEVRTNLFTICPQIVIQAMML